jgi:hypothetical protein
VHLHAWAARWQIPLAAISELQMMYGLNGTANVDADLAGKTEAFVQSQIVLEAAQKGIRLYRNNVGALADDTGRVVRYGLANDSKSVNEKIKSGDLIGIRPVTITPAHVGYVIGQFISREAKRPGWKYSGQGREPAQLAWAEHVCALGGDGAFCTGPGSL